MFQKLIHILKPWAGAVLLILVLKLTGLMGDISYMAQSAVLKTGLMNAGTEADLRGEDFDYNFTIKNLQGDRIDFNEFKGKVIFLNMWATWCGPCRAEMPTIQKLFDKIDPEKQIQFVMLSIDRDSNQEKVVQYLKNKKYTFPAYMPSGYLTEQLNVPSIPTTFIISKDGKILTKEVGTTNFNTAKFLQFLTAEAEK